MAPPTTTSLLRLPLQRTTALVLALPPAPAPTNIPMAATQASPRRKTATSAATITRPSLPTAERTTPPPRYILIRPPTTSIATTHTPSPPPTLTPPSTTALTGRL